MTQPPFPRPMIAIVGRPNVGKSTLFNRIIGHRTAVISPMRGTTRDRLYGRAEWRGTGFTILDTGGVELATEDDLIKAVQRHIDQALAEADRFLFVCDAREGLLPADELIMARLRKTGKPIVLAVNKADHQAVVPPEFFALRPADPLAISALHGRGIGELLDRLLEAADGRAPEAPGEAPTAVAIVGRPNVGKSSLLNALLREERAIVSELPGTTRDALDTPLLMGGVPVLLIDTAGLRHRRKVKQPVDFFSMARAIEAIQRCDVALVLLDAVAGVTRDDRRIVARACEVGCGLVLVVNKWDLMRGGTQRRLQESVHRALPFAAFAPALAVSATTGFQVPQVLTTALRVARAMRRGCSDVDCLASVREAWTAHPPPRQRDRLMQLLSSRWIAGKPPRIELATRPAGSLPGGYQRYLLNALQADPRFAGVPLRLSVAPRTSRKRGYARKR